MNKYFSLNESGSAILTGAMQPYTGVTRCDGQREFFSERSLVLAVGEMPAMPGAARQALLGHSPAGGSQPAPTCPPGAPLWSWVSEDRRLGVKPPVFPGAMSFMSAPPPATSVPGARSSHFPTWRPLKKRRVLPFCDHFPKASMVQGHLDDQNTRWEEQAWCPGCSEHSGSCRVQAGMEKASWRRVTGGGRAAAGGQVGRRIRTEAI